MKRTVLALSAAILCVATFVLPISVFAQNPTSEELLAKARDTVSQSLIGPHHLEAEVTVVLANGKKGKGSYSLYWAAPDRFREEIHIPGFDGIKIASGTTLYYKRNVDYIPLRALQLEELMDVSAALDQFQRDVSPQIQDANSKESSADQHGVSQLVVKRSQGAIPSAVCISRGYILPVACVDEKQGWPLEITDASIEEEDTLTFSRYDKLKKGYIPREARYIENGAVNVEARLKKIASVKQFDASTFTPPEGAEQAAWCFDLVPAVRQAIKAPPSVSYEDFPEPEILYGLVRADGTLQKVAILETAGAKADGDVRSMADSIRFRPASCNGKPVESEARFTIADLNFLAASSSDLSAEAGKNGYSVSSCAYCPIPPFTDAAFWVKTQGTVVLTAIIAPDGRAHDVIITKRIGYGLDESAAMSVRKFWRFKPATGPDGKPAAVHMLVEVDFNIY